MACELHSSAADLATAAAPGLPWNGLADVTTIAAPPPAAGLRLQPACTPGSSNTRAAAAWIPCGVSSGDCFRNQHHESSLYTSRTPSRAACSPRTER